MKKPFYKRFDWIAVAWYVVLAAIVLMILFGAYETIIA